jgi:hypothetical protein
MTAAFAQVAARSGHARDQPSGLRSPKRRTTRPGQQLMGGRDLRCPRQDGTCPRWRSAGPQLPDTARSGRNCGHGSPPPGPARTAWALLRDRRTVNPPIARYNFLYLSSRPALRGRRLRRPPSRRQHNPMGARSTTLLDLPADRAQDHTCPIWIISARGAEADF